MKNDPGFWRRFWAGLGLGTAYLGKGEVYHPPGPAVEDGSGTVVSTDVALKRAAVWACVRLRSQTIATLPLHLKDKDKNLATNHPIYQLLYIRPNADMTASEFWESMISAHDMEGNAYAIIQRNGQGVPISLYPQDPRNARLKRLSNGQLRYQFKGEEGFPHKAEDVLHIKGFTLDGLVGLSAIRYAASTIGILSEADEAVRREFSSGMKAGGFIQTGERRLTPEQRSRLHASLSEFSRPENAGRWMTLEAGVEPVPMNQLKINPIDAQLLESRYFSIEEICRIFNVPPQLIGHTDKASSWASSLENTNLGFLTYSLRPTLVRIEQAVSRKLLTPAERERYSPKFSVEGLLRTDSSARASFYQTMVSNGLFTRNEVRALEDKPRLEGADDLTVQVNMAPLDSLGAQDNEEK